MAEALTIVRTEVPRVDGRDKVTGRSTFVSDMVVPGMLHARILRSPHPHARITRIDTEAAKALPGVAVVLTGADLTDVDPYYGPAFKINPYSRSIACASRAIRWPRWRPDPLIGDAALNLIVADYEPLPAATTSIAFGGRRRRFS